MTSASFRTFETYELLEQILMQIPMKRLFNLRRVSRSWLELMERSGKLRKKMFLVADTEPQKPKTLNVPNKIIYEHNLRLNPAMEIVCTSASGDADEHTVASALGEFLGVFAVRPDSKGREPKVAMLCRPPLAVPPPGSWQKLYLTQPQWWP